MLGVTPIELVQIMTAVLAGCITILGAIIGAWKLAKIEAHVNSEKTMMHERSLAKDREMALLRELLAKDRTTADLLAQAVATKQQVESRASQETSALMGALLKATPGSDVVPVVQKVEVVNTTDAPVPTTDATNVDEAERR